MLSMQFTRLATKTVGATTVLRNGRLKSAMVVIVGDADKVEPEASLRAAFGAVLPTAKFIVLPGTGHLGPLESAADVTDAVRVALADASRV